jgi:hypothetical protein
MLRFIHAVGLLKLAVLVPVHACTHKIILVFVCGTYVPTLAYLWYLVQSYGLYVVEARGAILSVPGLRATSGNILWSTTKVNEACARPPHVA